MNQHILNHRSLLSLLAAAALTPAMAQFDQTIAVEGKYKPEIIRLDRINTFPRQERFSLETTPLAYDATGIPAAFAPRLYPMGVTGWRDSRKVADNRGYLELGAGSWLNSTLSAGYRFIQDANTVMGIRLQHNSTSLWQPKLSENTSDIRRYRYDEALGLYGSHLFNGVGRLDAAVDYHIGNFNYYGINPFGLGSVLDKAPTQTLNDIAARIGWQSPVADDNISWNANVGVRYFGYRSMYEPSFSLSGTPTFEGFDAIRSTRETDLNIKGGVAFPLAPKSTIGIDIKGDALFYGGAPKGTDAQGASVWQRADSYTIFTLTPYYRFAIDKLNLRLGVDLDLAAGAKSHYGNGDKYGTFHVAPDVMLDYNAGAARFYLHLMGGSRLHTMASGYELNYYQQPYLTNTCPVYTPLDGDLGVSFGPFSGFSAGLKFAYRISRGEYLGGWYQEMLNWGSGIYDISLASGLPTAIDGRRTVYSFNEGDTYNLHGYSLGANLAYDAGKAFRLDASGTYQPQKGETGYFNGLDRPRWVADISAQTNPWNTLKLRLSYGYRGVRNSYISATYRNDKGFYESVLVARRLADVTSLNFGASYSFTDNFGIWIQADNLLNRKIETLPGLPTEGINIVGGLSVVF